MVFLNSGILEIASNRIQPKKATWGWERGMSGDIERFSSKNLRLLKMIIKISNKLVDDYSLVQKKGTCHKVCK